MDQKEKRRGKQQWRFGARNLEDERTRSRAVADYILNFTRKKEEKKKEKKEEKKQQQTCVWNMELSRRDLRVPIFYAYMKDLR